MSALLTVTPLHHQAIGGGLEGAEHTSRETLRWSPPIISPDQQINAVKDVADSRSRDTIQNDGYAMGAVHTHRDSIVGSQYRLNAQPEFELLGADERWAEEFQMAVEPRFNLLADSPDCYFDASGMNTLTGLIRLAIATFTMTGEVLSTVEWLRGNGRPFSTALQMISPTRLSNPDGEMDNTRLRRGVKKDKFGAPIGYYIRSAHPGTYYADDSFPFWKYVEARKPWGRLQVIHIIEQLQPDQTRGISDMVSALKNMRMTKKFKDITLQNAVVNATYAAAIESELPKELVFGAMGAGQTGFADMLGAYMTALQNYLSGSDNIAIDGVKMPHLFPGTKLALKPAGTPGGVGTDFEESLLRHIAAPLGLSYEEFAKDFSKTNYSSARASMASTGKFMNARKKFCADRYANCAYRLWLEEEMNAGNVPLPKGFTADTWYSDPVKREALCGSSWIGASRGQIDEMKETQSAIMRIKAGLSTYEIEVARLGEDFRKVFRQRAREDKMMKKLGLVPDMEATKPGANDRQQTMKDNKEEEES